MKQLSLAITLLAGLACSSCTDERSPEGAANNKASNKPATTLSQDTIARDNTGTLQNGGSSTNGGSSSGGGTGNGGQ